MSMDWNKYESVKVLAAQSCPILCDPMDCSPRVEHGSLALQVDALPSDGYEIIF